MSSLYSRRTPEDQSGDGSIWDAIDRAQERAALIDEQVPKHKGGRPKGVKNKRKLPPIDHKAIQAQIADIGHLYSRPALIVVQCPSVSLMAKALYWWLDARCFDGNTIQPARADIIVGQDEITEALGIERKAVARYIDELRQHGFVYREGRGHLKFHRYRLPLRERRIESDAELKARRRADVQIKPIAITQNLDQI